MIDFKALDRSLTIANNPKQLYKKIVEAPFEQAAESAFLFLGFMTFCLVDTKAKIVKLAGHTDNEQYWMSVDGYGFKPEEYMLSLDKDADNDIVKAILTGRPQETSDWGSLTRRTHRQDDARLNQASGGIAYSAAYPLGKPPLGAILFCYFQYPHNIGQKQKDFMRRYAQIVAKNLTATSKH